MPPALPPHRRLSGVGELVALCGDDPHVRAEADPQRVSSTWANDTGAYGWITPSRRVSGRDHLTAYGDAEAAAALVAAVDAETSHELGSVTLPRDANRHLPAGTGLDPRADWEWMARWAPPPRQPLEDEVGWLDPVPIQELATFLDRESPRHDARPGRAGVLRWCGSTDQHGRLVAVAAHTERVPGVPHLASIATAASHRGRGYGAAVTAWLTRTLLAEGSGWVTLGMYSDNTGARRVYQRLGFSCDHRFTSGALVRR